MILDASGREWRRSIGFGSEMRPVPTSLTRETFTDAVGYQSIPLEQNDGGDSDEEDAPDSLIARTHDSAR